MSVIIRLQNLPLTASSIDIRSFFHGLSIPDGGVHIVGGPEGDAFIAFSTDEDARQAMRLAGQRLKQSPVSLLLSSRNEMFKVIEQARVAALAGGGGGGGPPSSSSHQQSSNTSHHFGTHLGSSADTSSRSPPLSHHHVPSSNNNSLLGRHHQQNSGNNSNMSTTASSHGGGAAANDYLRSITNAGGHGHGQPDLSSNPALLFGAIPGMNPALAATQNAFLTQQQNQAFSGMGSAAHSAAQQQSHGGFGGASSNNNAVTNATATPTTVFPNGNPFLIPPPGMAGIPFPGILHQGANHPNANNSHSSSAGNSSAGGLGIPQTSAMMSLAPNFMNSTMSMAGGGPPNSMNPFMNSAPPRMGMNNNGGMMGMGAHAAASQQSQQQGAGSMMGGGPRHNMNNFGMGGGGMNQSQNNAHGGGNNAFGAGVGANNSGGGGNRQQQQQHFGNRPPFGNMGGGGGGGNNQQQNQNRFQLGAIPSGRMDGPGPNNNRDTKRGRSPSKERRGGGGPPGADNDLNNARRRRSRSRDRDRRRRRSPRSHSRSRSRSRDRALGGGGNKRRESRDKRDAERKGRGDSSPEKSSQDSAGASRRRPTTEHEPSPPPTSLNTTTEEWPGAKLTGIPGDASYREIKEFIRVEVMGGSDGVVRLYDEGVAFLKLQNPSEFPRVFRSNGRKLRGSPVAIEGILMETWTQEYKLNKSRLERDIDRDREEREKERESRRASDREKEHGHGRGDRDTRHSQNSHSSSGSGTHHHRSSRFSNASVQSSCIAIRGLAPTVTKQELVSRYLRDTPCQDVVLIAAPTPTNRHSVTAFVQFESAQVSQTVINGIVRSPLGSQLVVESCDVDDLQKAKDRTSGSAGNMGNKTAGPGMNSPGMSMMMGGGGGADAKSIFELDLGLVCNIVKAIHSDDDETTTIIMKGAPPNISERDVFDFFSDIGLAPMNVRILYDTDGQCSGQVICEFPDNNKAKRATTKDGMLFGRGQISVSLLPSRNKKPPSQDFGGGQPLLQPSYLNNRNNNNSNNNSNNNPRLGLLGPAPPRGGGGRGNGGGDAGGGAGMSRFSNPSPNPTSNSPNIFEQALQQQVTAPMTRPPPTMGGRSGNSNSARGGRGERMSRFSNNDNNRGGDFRNQNGVGVGLGRGRAGGNGKDLIITDDDMALFNKKGCVIGLENIPYKASMDDILQYLEETLKIAISPDRIIRRYDDKQKPTGDARVAFDTAFEAKLACDRIAGTYMWKRLVSAAVID